MKINKPYSYAQYAMDSLEINRSLQKLRDMTLRLCDTQEEKNKYLDRWVIEDSAKTIASAIRNRPTRLGLFGF